MDFKRRSGEGIRDDAAAWGSEDKDFISKISDESLLRIFTFVPVLQRLNLDRVCPRWKRINKFAWRDVETIDYNNWPPGQRSSQSEIHRLIKLAGKNFKRLTLVQNLLHHCEPSILAVINHFCRNLVELELNLPIYLTNEFDFVGAFSEMKKLKKFKIHDSKCSRSKLNPSKVYLCIFENLPKEIESISISSSYESIKSLSNFHKIFKTLKCLRCLTLRRWTLDVSTMREISKLKSLHHLDLKNSTLRDAAFFIPYLVELEHLDLEGTDSVVPKLVIDIINKCKKLVHLSIGSSKVNGEAIEKLSNLKNLKELRINSMPINDYRLNQLANLRRLDCRDCTRVTDAGVTRIFIHCPEIEYLDISGTKATVASLQCATIMINRRTNLVNLCIVANKTIAHAFARTHYNKRDQDASSRLEIIIREQWNETCNNDDFIDRYFENESQRYDCPVDRMKREIKVRQKNQVIDYIVEKPNDENLINNLSDDCLANVFKFIPPFERLQMKLVCKKWFSASDVAWYDVKKLSFSNHKVNTGKVGKLLQHCGHYLTELKLFPPFQCETRLVPLIREYCDQLKRLELCIRSKHWDWLQYVNAFSQMKQLNYIKIIDSKYKYNQADFSQVYATILESLNENIEEIHFELIEKRLQTVSDDMFLKFNKLTHLTLNYWTFDQETLEVIFQKSTLINLNLKSSRLPSHGLLSIGNLINLEHLNITNTGSIDTRIFLKNISKLVKLETLIMNHVTNADSIDQVIYGMNKLKVFEADNCELAVTDIGVMKVLRNCHELNKLSVSGTDITEGSLTCAVRTTKARKNDIFLKMFVSHQAFDEFRATVDESSSKFYTSPLLKIEVTDREEEDDDDNSENSESQDSDYYDDGMMIDEGHYNYLYDRMDVFHGHLFYQVVNEPDHHVVENRRDENGPDNIRRLNNNGHLVDGRGRRVDNQGNLLDDDGNRIDSYADLIGDDDEW